MKNNLPGSNTAATISGDSASGFSHSVLPMNRLIFSGLGSTMNLELSGSGSVSPSSPNGFKLGKHPIALTPNMGSRPRASWVTDKAKAPPIEWPTRMIPV